MIARDRDTNTGSAGFETREYILQNWRADVVALVNPAAYGDGNSLQEAGRLIERITYDAYGIPFATHPTDLTKGAIAATSGYGMPDGVLNNDDYSYFLILYGNTDPRADWNKDGTISAADSTAFLADYGAATGSWGRGVLSNRGNILGYAGYVHEPATGSAGGGHGTMWHCRLRVIHAGLGRWIQRDPAGYVDGPHLTCYLRSSPIPFVDPMGLTQCPPLQHFSETQGEDFETLFEHYGCECAKGSIANTVGFAPLWSALTRECALSGHGMPSVNCCSDCPSGWGGFYDAMSHMYCICTDEFGFPLEGYPDSNRTAYHELTHALQSCVMVQLTPAPTLTEERLALPGQLGAQPNADPAAVGDLISMCYEIDAFCGSPFDPYYGDCTTPTQIDRVCDTMCNDYNFFDGGIICDAMCRSSVGRCRTLTDPYIH